MAFFIIKLFISGKKVKYTFSLKQKSSFKIIGLIKMVL